MNNKKYHTRLEGKIRFPLAGKNASDLYTPNFPHYRYNQMFFLFFGCSLTLKWCDIWIFVAQKTIIWAECANSPLNLCYGMDSQP